jgi:hypothetical protein
MFCSTIPTWGQAEVIEMSNPHYSTYPKVGMANDGSALAVWHQNNGSGWDIWSNRFE